MAIVYRLCSALLLSTLGAASFVAVPPGQAAREAARIAAAYREGYTALANGQADRAAIAFERAQAMNAGDDVAAYLAATSHARSGNRAAALTWLRRLERLGSCLVPRPGSFQSLEQDAEYSTIVQSLRAAAAGTHRSTPAFTIAQRDLIPEGIAYDPVERAFYVSSLFRRKIVKVIEDGTGKRVEDFTRPGQDGLLAVLGLRVDPRRRVLWAATAGDPEMEGYTDALAGQSAIHKYDLATGRLLKKYALPGTKRLFNDLAVNLRGDLFVTDSTSGEVLVIRADRDRLEVLVPAGSFLAPNGITLSDDGRTLFVADTTQGVYAVDVATATPTRILESTGPSTVGLDGLYFYRDSLIGVVNMLSGGRVLRFHLAPGHRLITRTEVLDCNNPAYQLPTTGALVNDDLYVLANSQFMSYSAPGKLLPADQLHDVVVLRTPLNGSSMRAPEDVPPAVSNMLRQTEWPRSGHQYGSACVRIAGQKVIYIDPADLDEGQAVRKADLILITHGHDDHFSPRTLDELRTPSTCIVNVAECAARLPRDWPHVSVIAPGQTVSLDGVTIEAVPAYNTASAAHAKARGWVRFVVTVDGVRLYHSGDTSRVPEMDAVRNIDIAFFIVRPTYMMSGQEAASAAEAIKPRVLIPIHWLDAERPEIDYLARHAPAGTRVVLLPPA